MPSFKHSFTIHVHHRPTSSRCSLSIVISVNGKRQDVPLGISCPFLAYNKESKSIVAVNGYDTAPIDNLHLQQSIADINRIFLQYELSADTPNVNDIITAFKATLAPPPDSGQTPQHRLIDVLDKFVDNQSVIRSWSEATLKKFRVLRSRISDYQPATLINDVNDDWLVSFMSYLSKGYTRTKKDGTVTTHYYRNTSLAKMLKNFRWLLRWAKKNGYYSGTSENFTMEFKGGAEPLNDIVFLTAEELHLLMDHKWQHGQQHLERVVDAFIFACYCGLRYSDIASLRRYHIHDNQIFTSIDKTTVKVAIPLNKVTTAILDKYADYNDKEGHPFPVISDQKSNLYIKEAAKICKIESTVNRIWYVGNKRHEESHKKCDVLSFHCARRTFITQALVLGIPDSVLIQFTGHTTTKMLKRYQGIVDDLKQKQISKFDTL